MLNFLEHLYEHARNTLLWFIVYFFLQTLIWIALGILILLYPQTLFILVAVFFVLLAAINIYLSLIFIKFAYRLKKAKDLIKIN